MPEQKLHTTRFNEDIRCFRISANQSLKITRCSFTPSKHWVQQFSHKMLKWVLHASHKPNIYKSFMVKSLVVVLSKRGTTFYEQPGQTGHILLYKSITFSLFYSHLSYTSITFLVIHVCLCFIPTSYIGDTKVVGWSVRVSSRIKNPKATRDMI